MAMVGSFVWKSLNMKFSRSFRNREVYVPFQIKYARLPRRPTRPETEMPRIRIHGPLPAAADSWNGYSFTFVSIFSTPTGVETPDVIDLRKQQRKEPEKPLYQNMNIRKDCSNRIDQKVNHTNLLLRYRRNVSHAFTPIPYAACEAQHSRPNSENLYPSWPNTKRVA
ncbi:splicing factor 3B subunit 2 [Artemisia annua]|uniref:Splicing factor 3B subunit 2 n=1 Tax=Artemisia annua TaxID=35608 RepID=A0A2U1PRC3_ARTAN|nr:splicing factor 3B subunit 2 [Artemisia annua]